MFSARDINSLTNRCNSFISRKSGSGEGEWFTCRLICTQWLLGMAVTEKFLVGTWWANFHLGRMNGLRDATGDSFLAGKAVWVFAGQEAGYFKLINE